MGLTDTHYESISLALRPEAAAYTTATLQTVETSLPCKYPVNVKARFKTSLTVTVLSFLVTKPKCKNLYT